MTRQSPFAPAGNGVTVQLDVLPLTSHVVQFDALLPVGTPSKSPSVYIVNAGASGAFLEFVGGQGDQTAAKGTGMYLPSGAQRVFGTNGATFVAAIGDGGGTTLYITPGTGL